VRAKYCYKCRSPDHLASFHNPSTGSGRGQLRPASKPGVKNTGNAGGARVNRCAVICDESASQKPVAAARSTSDDLPSYRIVHDAETLDLMQELTQYADNYDTNNYTTTHNDNTVTASVDSDSHAVVNRVINLTKPTPVNPPVLLSKMHYRDVLVEELGRNVVALEDSGAKISIVFSNMIRDLNLVSLGKINLSGIVGDPVQADLVQMHIKPANHSVNVNEHENCSERTDNIAPFVSVIFAVCDKLSNNHDLIFTADVVEHLNDLNSYTVNKIVSDRPSSNPFQLNTVVSSQPNSDSHSTNNVDATTVQTDDDVRTADSDVGVDNENDGGERADTETLRAKQQADPSLQPWLKLATNKKGNFSLKNGLLFHCERVLENNVEQLVLPSSRIPSVLKLGHDAMFSGNYAYKNTLRRIRLVFFAFLR